MKLISLLLKRSRWLLTLAAVTAFIGGAANTGLLGLLKSAVDRLDNPSMGLAWTFFGLCLLVPLMRIASELLLIRLGQGTVLTLRMELSRRVLGVGLRRLEKIGPHRILSTLTADIPSITNSVIMLPVLCFNIAIVITCFLYLFYLSWSAFTALLVFMVVGIAGYQLPVIRATAFFRDARETNDTLYGHFEALTHGLKELKLHRRRREAFLEHSLQDSARLHKAQNTAAMGIYAIASSWGQFMVFFVLGLLTFVLPAVMTMSQETVIGYMLIFLYMTSPLQVLMNALPTLNRSTVALRRIEQLGLDLEANPDEAAMAAKDAQALTPSWERLELAGTTHTYRLEGEERDFTLGPIHLTFEPGELVFLVGGNGSGKTTLAKLICGLYLPEEGEIHLDGAAIDSTSRDAYRQLFTVVFSDFYLFDQFLGLDTPELDRRAKDYLRRLKLDHKVEVENGSLSTTELSQGQRKRLALLTAYLEDRPIYLFDEWAADQDPSFKQFFYRVLLPELQERGKTVIVISHDDAYYTEADRLIKLDYGQIVADTRAAKEVANLVPQPG